MKTVRPISALALVAALALLAPAPASAQHVRVFAGSDYALVIPAAANQEVRVTVANPRLVVPEDESAAQVDFYLKLQGVDGESTSIRPGESHTHTLAPREVGRLVDPRTGLWHVTVSFRVEMEVFEEMPAAQPAVLVELVDSRTGKVESFHAFEGFRGGVFVAAGDLD